MKNFILLFATLFTSATIQAEPDGAIGAGKYLNTIKNDPEKLYTFLTTMPKGGDLHNHEGGSSMAENIIYYSRNDAFCVDPKEFNVAISTGCPASLTLASSPTDPKFYNAIIAAWSMEGFQPGGKETGHDHFFAAFDKFFPAIVNHLDDVDAEIIERAGIQNESYVELMVSPDITQAIAIGTQTGWNPDFNIMRTQLLKNGLDKLIPDMTTVMNITEQKVKSTLQCGTPNASAGCNVKIRYLYQVLREYAPEAVFAQLLAGFELANQDNRFLGINMVQPEDGTISMRDYKLHMRIVQYLHNLYPKVHITLHAGELNSDLVPPEGLTFHIHDAVNTAQAERIGHGVDIIHENNYPELLQEMAKKRIMVEINLTSNDLILNVSGKNHPLPLYIQSNVPVALSTDDEGVDRTNLTKEYIKAVHDFQFNYLTLKKFVRNSITYSFLPGETLWTDADYLIKNPACQDVYLGGNEISASCQKLLDTSEKAKMQWDLEKRFIQFESRFR